MCEWPTESSAESLQRWKNKSEKPQDFMAVIFNMIAALKKKGFQLQISLHLNVQILIQKSQYQSFNTCI